MATELQRAGGAVDSLSYRDLRRNAESIGRWLRDNGIPRGARCAILAENGPSWVGAYLGVMAAGAVAVPLDTAFNAGQIEKLLHDCGANVIFTDGQHLPQVERAVDKNPVQIATVDSHPKFPSVHAMIADGPAEFVPASVENSDLAVIMYTSGTTSDPKGVMLTHSNLLAEAEAVFAAVSVSERDSILAVLPLFHALAQMANLLLPFAAGARIVYLEDMNTSELLRALAERDVTLFCCVPQFFYLIHERIMKEVQKRSWPARTAFRVLLSISSAGRGMGMNPGKLFFGKVHRMLGPRMRYLVTGGSAFDPKIGHDLENLGFNVLQAYGLTETTGGAFVTPPDDNVMGSVGRPLPGVSVKIVDASSEAVKYPVGEIAISGGIVMKGYYNRPDATAEVMRDGWFLSGDLGYLDPRGNLFITGRKKEIIVLSSGKNIYPEELEAQYLRSPFVKEICVMGLAARPGEPVSERLHAVIVPDFEVLRERKIVNAREVIRFDVENLSTELPSTKRILSFDLWRDPLPRTTTRKLKRFEILRRVQAGDPSEGETAEAQGKIAEEPTGEEAAWLSDPLVEKAMAVIRRSSKVEKPILPSSNLELDLGLDSMERVELVVALEGDLGAETDDRVISAVYTVRELVDTILQSRNGAGSSPSARSTPGWDAVLATPPDDPHVLAALHGGLLLTFAWFVFGKFVSLFMRVFFRLKVSGKEKLPANGPFILSPNHQSFIDGPVVASQIPWRLFRDMFYVGTSEIFGQGILNYLGRTFRLVPVDPDSNLVNAMRAGAFGLKQGYNLVLYPEGERSIDGTPKKFKKGAAILSTHLKVPIYPVALEGFYEAWPRGKRFPRLARLRIRFGDPIEPPATEAVSEDTYRQLTEKLRDRVVKMWEGLREQSPRTSAAAGDSRGRARGV